MASITHLALMSFFVGLLYLWTGNPRRNALLLPVGGTLLMVIFVKALKMCVTKKVEWRGTAYTHTMAQDLVPAGTKPSPAPHPVSR